MLQRRICDSPRTMAEDLTPQSAVEARIASATIRLARVQLGLRKVQYPRHTDWIAALEGVERPMTATQILTVLLDSNDAPYQGEPMENKYVDLAIAVGRLSDAGKEAFPDQAARARAFVKPLLIFLHGQSTTEAEQLQAALTSQAPLLSPVGRTRAPDFSTALPHATAPKKSAEEQVQELVGSLTSFAYLDLPPYQRLNNKSIMLFLDAGHNTISFPRYSDLERGGRAQDLAVGQEEFVSFFMAIISMVLLKYHKATPEHVDESPVDLQSERMTVTITEADGNKTEQERAVFFSVRTFNKLANMMAYPYASVHDDTKRKELCIQLWGEIQAAAATIGRRTLTSLMTDILERSPTTAAATAAVAAQSRKKPAVTPTPAKKPSGAASSSSSAKRMLNPRTQRPKRASADLRDCLPHRPSCQRHLPAGPVLQLVQGRQVQVLRPERVQLQARGPAQGQVPERSHGTAHALGASGFGVKHGVTRRNRTLACIAPHCPRLRTRSSNLFAVKGPSRCVVVQ